MQGFEKMLKAMGVTPEILKEKAGEIFADEKAAGEKFMAELIERLSVLERQIADLEHRYETDNYLTKSHIYQLEQKVGIESDPPVSHTVIDGLENFNQEHAPNLTPILPTKDNNNG